MPVKEMTGLLLTDVEENTNGGYESQQYNFIANGGYLGMSDNGGSPDGNAWLIWEVEVDDVFDSASNSVNSGALPVKGFQAQYHQAFKECTSQFIDEDKIYWSGVSSDSLAFFVPRFRDNYLRNGDDLEEFNTSLNQAKKAAEICQKTYDEMLLDDDLETLAARVMG